MILHALVLTLSTLSSNSFAGSIGTIQVKPDGSEAVLNLHESTPDQKLWDFYMSLNLPEERLQQGMLTKRFKMSNERFSLICSRSETVQILGCRFTIRSGSNTADLNSTIGAAGMEKWGVLGMTAAYSQEFSRIFGASPEFNYSTPNGKVRFSIEGATTGHLSIGFSEN